MTQFIGRRPSYFKKSMLSNAAIMGLVSGFFGTPPAPNEPREKKRTLLITPPAYKAVAHYEHPNKRLCLINKMTNWQRHQAAKACKGHWKRLTDEDLEKFTRLTHWKAGETP